MSWRLQVAGDDDADAGDQPTTSAEAACDGRIDLGVAGRAPGATR